MIISQVFLFVIVILFVSVYFGVNLNSSDKIKNGSIFFGGLERTYLIYIPSVHDEAKPMPLVIALHGGGGTGKDMIKLTRGGFNALAEKEGFAVVYPDGTKFSESPKVRWNDGRDERYSQADDVGFISALIDNFVRTENVDRNRVYVTGISNGAHMAMRLAREASDKIAAVAPVAYSMQEKYASVPVASRPISLIILTGTKDPITPYNGGETPDPFNVRELGRILPVPATVDILVAHNKCALPPIISKVSDHSLNDDAFTRKEAYENCLNGTEVVLYAINNGGHTWPGGWQYLPERFIGKTSNLDANEVIWNFFKNHSLN